MNTAAAETVPVKPMVTVTFDIPQELYDEMTAYVEARKDYDTNRVGTLGLSLFLLQNGSLNTTAARIYLDNLFKAG